MPFDSPVYQRDKNMRDLPVIYFWKVSTAWTLQCDTQETSIPSTWQKKQLHPILVACQQTWKTLPAHICFVKDWQHEMIVICSATDMACPMRFAAKCPRLKIQIRGYKLTWGDVVKDWKSTRTFSLPSYLFHFAKRGTTQRQISFLWKYFKRIGHPKAKCLKWIWTHQNNSINLVLMSWGSLPSKRKG